MRAALVITTYNQPKNLALCLESLANQTCSDFEIFIADDGSNDETAQVIDRFRKRLSKNIRHYWHADLGYRKATINNLVFSKIQPDEFPVTICVDHDVVLHFQFIEDHLREHRRLKKTHPNQKMLFMGRRVDLGPTLSKSLREDRIQEFNRGISFPLWVSWLKGETRLISRAFHIQNSFVNRLLGRERVYDLLGSNFSISTELLLQVNGYNEEFKAYWGEDGDLFVRVRNSGAVLRGRKGYAIQYHVDHPRLEPNPEHQKRYEMLLKTSDYVFCPQGIQKSAGANSVLKL